MGGVAQQPPGFLKALSVLVGGTFVGQLLVLVSSFFSTRLYTPEDFGLFGLVVSFLGFAVVLGGLRLELALPNEPETSAGILLKTTLIVVVLTSTLGMVLFFVLQHFGFLGFGRLPLWSVPLVHVCLFLISGLNVLRYWMIRQAAYSMISKFTVAQNLVRAVGQVVLGFFNAGFLGLTLTELASRAVGARVFWRSVAGVFQTTALSWQAVAGVFKEKEDFLRYGVPSAAIDTLASVLVLPLIVQLYGPENAGHFALVQRVVALPLGLIGTSVADVFHHEMANLAGQADAAKALFHRRARFLLLLGLVPSVVLFFWGPSLFVLFFGETWLLAGEFSRWLAPLLLAQLVVSPLTRIVLVFDGQAKKFLYDTINFAGTVLAFVAGRSWGWDVLTTIKAYVGFQVLAFCVYFVLLVQMLAQTPNRTKSETNDVQPEERF